MKTYKSKLALISGATLLLGVCLLGAVVSRAPSVPDQNQGDLYLYEAASLLNN